MVEVALPFFCKCKRYAITVVLFVFAIFWIFISFKYVMYCSMSLLYDCKVLRDNRLSFFKKSRNAIPTLPLAFYSFLFAKFILNIKFLHIHNTLNYINFQYLTVPLSKHWSWGHIIHPLHYIKISSYNAIFSHVM